MQRDEVTLEPDRYELREDPPYQFTSSRREFFEAAGFLIFLTRMPLNAQDGGPPRARVKVAADGAVTVYTGKVEVGQGSRTELTIAVAEELRVPMDRIRVVMGDTDLCPNDGLTAGSRTTPSTVPPTRKEAADHRGGPVTDSKDWKVLGRDMGRTDARDIVTGVHAYPSDIKRPGMQYGSVLRAPAYNSKLVSADTTAAEKLPGVKVVKDGGFVACSAATSYGAREAVKAIAAKWDTQSHPASKYLYEVLKRTAKTPREQTRGDVAAGLASATKRVEATYKVPFIQHAPMEPRAAVAEWVDGKLTVWTGTQNPFGVQQQLQQAFKLGSEKVRVIVPDTGGGFGGKHTGEVAIEAAKIAKETGHPISLRWTRAEEFMWAYFRPAGLFEISAGVDSDGKLTAWDYSNYNAGTAAMESPYKIVNSRTRYYATDSPLREGSYRGIAATANHFARECCMEELAGAAGLDPVEFRLRNIENPRLRDVLVAVTNNFDWKSKRKNKRKNIGVGVAAGTEKGSYVAACAEIETGGPNGVVVRDFHMAFECGKILNPSNLRAQVIGSIIQGMGGALTEEIEFADGKLLNGSFAKYRMPRFRDVPDITVTLLDRPDLVSVGAGETPIVAVAPAIASAYFDATGQRARQLPVGRHT
jgi:nicotinate dehydrogenase subunit B